MAADPRFPRNVMTPDFREFYDKGFSDSFVRPFEELFFAVNAGTQGRDRIYELEYGSEISDSPLSILVGNLDASGILTIPGGGTGASTAAGARTNLGLEIGVDVLAYDANLQAFISVFTLPIADGTAGYALGTDGAGNLDFVPAGNQAIVATANLAVYDDGVDDNYTINWTVGADISDANHDLKIYVFKNGSYAGSVTEASPNSTLTQSITGTGDGDDTIDHHHAILQVLNTDGDSIYSLVASAQSRLGAILLETGDYLLLETGDLTLLE